MNLKVFNEVTRTIRVSLLCLICCFLALGCTKKKRQKINFRTGFFSGGNIKQKQIVAKLSGTLPIAEQFYLKERYSTVNKQVCRKFLLDYLREFCDSVYIHDFDFGENIVGLIRSTTPSPDYVIIGAHYDTVEGSPGANDNASGVALVSSVAEHISQMCHRNLNTIVVFFDLEERRLDGSRAFAKKMIVEEVSIHSVHTVDQIGWDNEVGADGFVGDSVIEIEKPTRDLERLYTSVSYELPGQLSVCKTEITSSDHHSFRMMGFQSVGITEEFSGGDRSPHYHRSSDTFETMNFEYLFVSTEFLKAVFERILLCQ